MVSMKIWKKVFFARIKVRAINASNNSVDIMNWTLVELKKMDT